MAELLSQLQSVLQVTIRLTSATESQTLFQQILASAVRLLDAEGGAIYFFDSPRQVLTFKYVITGQAGVEEKLRKIELKVGEGIAGYCAQKMESVVILDAQKDERFYRAADRQTGYVSRNLLSVPMKYYRPDRKQDVLVGVIQVVNKRDGTFTPEDVTMLEALASQGATLIERTTLYEQLRETFTGTIEALTAALDSRDPYTHGHTRRVAKYSVNTALWMELSSHAVFDLRLSALLHDIGKVGIPDNVLKKQGALTAEEFKIMATHTLEGYKILRPVKLSPDILGGVLHHHEKWDGTGYPKQLKGEAIPLFGRIIGVADTYDAMTSDRPYRKALEPDVAVKEIVAQKGRQFDPVVADAFAGHFDEIIL